MADRTKLTSSALSALGKLPLMADPIRRQRVITAQREIRRRRRHLFERFGSRRYSRPALNDLDRRLEPYLRQDGGVFVEAGANDGYRQSNTYHLERFRGWSGVLVEAVPQLAARCIAERPRSRVFNCALVPDGGPDAVVIEFRGLESRISDGGGVSGELTYGWEQPYAAQVPGRTLTSVLEEAGTGRIDFLSLDVEGHEVEVVSGLDLNRFSPRYILIETNGAEDTLSRLLGERYELVQWLTSNDALFRSVS